MFASDTVRASTGPPVVAAALETALVHASSALARLPGVTVVASDNSGSMTSPVSAKSIVTHQAAANLMAAIAQRISDDAHLIVFGESARLVPVSVSDSILTAMNRQASTNVGHATNTHRVLELMIEKKIRADRLILFSDMQCYSSATSPDTFAGAVAKYRAALNPALVVHSVDLAGYGTASLSTSDPRVNLVSGFSEKILRTVGEFERGLAAVDVPPTTEAPASAARSEPARTNATLDDIRARF